MNRLLFYLLGILIIVGLCLTDFLPAGAVGYGDVTGRHCFSFRYPSGIFRRVIDSYVMIITDVEGDTLHPDLMWDYSDEDGDTIGVWAFDSPPTTKASFWDTVGVDSLCSSNYRFIPIWGDTLPAESIGQSAFQVAIIPSWAFTDSIINDSKFLQSRIIQGKHVVTSTLTGAHILNNSVPGADLIDWSIPGSKIDTMEVDTIHMATGAATKRVIGAGAVGTEEIIDGTLLGVDCSPGFINNSNLLVTKLIPESKFLSYDMDSLWSFKTMTVRETLFVLDTKRREVIFRPPHATYSVDGLTTQPIIFWDDASSAGPGGGGDMLKDGTGTDTNVPCILLTTADAINFDWYIPPEFDISEDLEFYIVYSPVDVTAANWEVRFDLSYKQYGYGESATKITSTMVTTGVTDAADYILDDTTTYDYRRQEHGPFVIAGGTLPSDAPGTDMTIKLTLTLSGTSFTYIQLVHVDAVYNITRF
ncbi:MAG: hypothetical protein KJ970_13150 [Candidatus Eisenbacteria bacterium]|uniref:Uncharacterized protein n=1 Tax=Eiseniibacteriota bacterium TaxID=2212470 RepID=A0A948RXN5_UNCEI|nr:hypothetical protein [Candidatus Eisenbacteria bacterium]MBU1949183.1 hypothetical protein [Candidatus Eisenbacteria bacterium]MBU2691861.1 hypothetical protein [Candidatus Eisenbacteria bacterium]